LRTIDGSLSRSEADISDSSIVPESEQAALVESGQSGFGTEVDDRFRTPLVSLADGIGRLAEALPEIAERPLQTKVDVPVSDPGGDVRP
jgi:hypothetical protein